MGNSDDDGVKVDPTTGDPVPPTGISLSRRRDKRSRSPDVYPDHTQYVGIIVNVPARHFGTQLGHQHVRKRSLA